MGRMVTTSKSLFFLLLLLLLLFFCVALAALLPIAAAAEQDAVVKRLQEYLRIQTVHPDPDYALVSDFLLSQATSVGLEARSWEFVKEKPVILLSWNGTHPSLPSLLLNSHTDVVPAQKEKWIYHPFSAIQVHMMLRHLATVRNPSTVSEYSKEEKLDLTCLEDLASFFFFFDMKQIFVSRLLGVLSSSSFNMVAVCWKLKSLPPKS